MVDIRCQQRVLKDIQAVVFDKDGTLADSLESLRELAIRRARLLDAQIPGIGEPLLMAFGILDGTLDPLGLMAVGSRLENEIAAAAYIAETGRGWSEARTLAAQGFTEAEQFGREPAALFPESQALIAAIAQRGVKLGILSADSLVNVKAFVAHHQLQDYFQALIGAEGPLKPDPGLFHKICQQLEVSPAHTLMVGDSPGDIQMAQRAGAAGVIAINRQGVTPPDLQSADVVIETLSQIQLLPG